MTRETGETLPGRYRSSSDIGRFPSTPVVVYGGLSRDATGDVGQVGLSPSVSRSTLGTQWRRTSNTAYEMSGTEGDRILVPNEQH